MIQYEKQQGLELGTKMGDLFEAEKAAGNPNPGMTAMQSALKSLSGEFTASSGFSPENNKPRFIDVGDWSISTEPDSKGRLAATKHARSFSFNYDGDMGRGPCDVGIYFIEPLEVVKVKVQLMDAEEKLHRERACAKHYQEESQRLRELIAKRIDTKIANWFKRNLGRREYED